MSVKCGGRKKVLGRVFQAEGTVQTKVMKLEGMPHCHKLKGCSLASRHAWLESREWGKWDEVGLRGWQDPVDLVKCFCLPPERHGVDGQESRVTWRQQSTWHNYGSISERQYAYSPISWSTCAHPNTHGTGVGVLCETPLLLIARSCLLYSENCSLGWWEPPPMVKVLRIPHPHHLSWLATNARLTLWYKDQPLEARWGWLMEQWIPQTSYGLGQV